jgi:cysteine desulfurase
MNVDSASFSAHKIGGPKGTGALFLSKAANIEPIFTGGGQEKGFRPGTENIQGIFGFRLACEKCLNALLSNYENAIKKMDYLTGELKQFEEVVLIPKERNKNCSPYILKMAVPPVPGEVLVRLFSDKKIYLSTGSACSSRQQHKAIRVLENMGVSKELALSSIRLSFGTTTTIEELNQFLAALKQILPVVEKLKS